MKKRLIAFLLAAFTVLCTVSCGGDNTTTTDIQSDIPTESSTRTDAISTDAEDTDVLETEDCGTVEAVPDDGTQPDTQAPQTDEMQTSAQTQKPDEDKPVNGKPADTTAANTSNKPAEDETDLDTMSGEQLIFHAVGAFEDLNSFDNAFTAKLTGSMAGQSMTYTVGGTQIYKAKSGTDFDCSFDMTVKDTKGEITSESHIYYTDGKTHDTIDGKGFKQKMSRDEFLEYALGGMLGADLSFFGFKNYEKTKTNDGYTVKFSGLNAETQSKLDKILKENNVSAAINSVSGEANVNAKGYLTKLTVKLDANLKYNGMTIPVKADAELITSKHNSVSKVSMPSLSAYKTVDDLAGLKGLYTASQTVHTMIESGTFKLNISETASIGGAAKLQSTRTTDASVSRLGMSTFSISGKGVDGLGEYTFKALASLAKITIEDRDGKSEKTYTVPTANSIISQHTADTAGDVKNVETFSSKTQGDGKKYTYTLNETAGGDVAKRAFVHLNGVDGITQTTKYTYKVSQCSGYTVVDADGNVTEYNNSAKITYTVNGKTYTVDYTATVVVK